MPTRRQVLKAGAVFGVGAGLTVASPNFFGVVSAFTQNARTPDFAGTRLIAILAGGSAREQLGIRGGPDIQPGGPNGIAALRDGRLAILDTINRRVTFLTDGRVSSTTDLPAGICPLDIQAHDAGVTVFDPSAGALFALRGGAAITQSLPRAGLNAVSRISHIAGSPVLVEEDFTSYEQRYGRASRHDGYPDSRGGRITVAYEAAAVPARRRATLRQGDGTAFDIRTNNALGSVIALGRDDGGRSYFQVSELVPSSGSLDVDITLRRFAPNGDAAGIARVPVRGRFSQPRRAVTFAPNGDAFAIFPESTQTRVLQLEWFTSLPALAPMTALVKPSAFEANAAGSNLIPNGRADCEVIGNRYAHCTMSNGSWIALSGNVQYSRLANVRSPQYINNTPGTYYEVPYCWGGYNDPVDFIYKMNAGELAGNGNPYAGGWVPGTAGPDCSGMIQQCWGITNQKYNDTGLLNWTQDPQDQGVGGTLGLGDMWRLAGQHVRMHHYYPAGGGGDYIYEATANWGEKCFHPFLPWSEYPGYQWCVGNFTH